MALSKRLFWLFITVTYFLSWYFFSIHITLENGVFNQLTLPGEENIPFIPSSFFIYTSIYLGLLVPFFVLNTRKEFKAMLLVFFCSAWISKICWLAFPVKFTLRPNLAPHIKDSFMTFIALFYQLDFGAVNCFPSLHVAFVFLIYFLMKSFRPKWSIFFFFYALLVTLSTFTFKQHYIADALGGFILAALLWFALIRPQEVNSADSR